MLSPNATSEISWVWITDAPPASHITQVCNGLENFSYGKCDLKAEAPCFHHPPGTESFLLYLTHLHPGWRSSPGNRCHIVPWEDPRHAAPQRRPLEPAILALLNDPVHLALAELQLIVLLGLVGVQGQVAAGRGHTKNTQLASATVCPTSAPALWSRRWAETLLWNGSWKRASLWHKERGMAETDQLCAETIRG